MADAAVIGPGPATSHSSDPSPAILTRQLSRRFGSTIAVDGISFDVGRGEIFGVLGPNGAGKTTTIKMLITLLAPSGGAARVAGFDVGRDAAQVRRRIGYVPQLVSADGALSGRENLRLSARLYHLPRDSREARITHALRSMALLDVADRMTRTYSGGMVRRLEIAQAILHHPVALFLDEPTVGLDPVARSAVWQQVQRLRDDLKTTILLTTHYMEEADALCDRVAVMHRGRIAAIGTPAELKAEVGSDASLDDVFVSLTGADIDVAGGTYRDIGRTRRAAKRLG